MQQCGYQKVWKILLLQIGPWVSRIFGSCEKEYFPNLLEITLLCQIFVFWVRDFKFWLLAYFLIFFDYAKFQKDWTTFILDILQGSPLWVFGRLQKQRNGATMQFPEGLENTPFTIKMTVLALEQLLKGVFVIIAPSKMSVGTSEDYILAYCKILFVSYSFICSHL